MNSNLSRERQSEIKLQNIDTSDCGVIALQAVTGLSRGTAEKRAKKLAAYQPGIGVARGNLNKALMRMGYKLELVALITDHYTVATFAVSHEYGTFLIYTSGHVCSMVEGDLRNGEGEWHAPVEEAYRVFKA